MQRSSSSKIIAPGCPKTPVGHALGRHSCRSPPYREGAGVLELGPQAQPPTYLGRGRGRARDPRCRRQVPEPRRLEVALGHQGCGRFSDVRMDSSKSSARVGRRCSGDSEVHSPANPQSHFRWQLPNGIAQPFRARALTVAPNDDNARDINDVRAVKQRVGSWQRWLRMGSGSRTRSRGSRRDAFAPLARSRRGERLRIQVVGRCEPGHSR